MVIIAYVSAQRVPHVRIPRNASDAPFVLGKALCVRRLQHIPTLRKETTIIGCLLFRLAKLDYRFSRHANHQNVDSVEHTLTPHG